MSESKTISVQLIAYGSREYQAEVALRQKILRSPLGLKFSADELEPDRHSIHVGAIENTRLLGCLLLTAQDGATIKMRQVAVDVDAQGRGVGRMLVAFAESFARDKGFFTMVLNARSSALSFYQSLAYQIERGPFEEVGVEHFRMFKKL